MPATYYNLIDTIAGAETKDKDSYFVSLTGTDYMSINTTTPIAGAADFLWNKTGVEGGESWKYKTFQSSGGYNNVSSSFKLKVVIGPPTGRSIEIHNFFGSSISAGVGLSGNGANTRICLMEDSTSQGNTPILKWEGSTNLVVGTTYIVQWKFWNPGGTIASIWNAILNLYDASGALLESSGRTTLDQSPFGSTVVAQWAFGNGFSNDYLSQVPAGFVLSYKFDNAVIVFGGAWAPVDANIAVMTPGTAEGTDTVWTLGAGADEWTATKEIPSDGDTSYINSGTGFGRSQTYNATASGISLSAGQEILAIAEFVRVKTDSGTGLFYPRYRIANGNNTSSGGVGSTTTYKWARHCKPAPTGLGWTVAQLDAMEPGVGKTVGSTNNRCSTIVVEALYGNPYFTDQMGWYSPTVETQSPQFSRPLLRRDSRNFKSYVTIDPWILTQAGTPPGANFPYAVIIIVG